MIFLAAIVLTSAYVALVLVLTHQWQQIPFSDKRIERPKVFTSILIPVRNEAQGIDRLIQSILKNNITDQEYEILVIDDHSEDETAEIVRHLMVDNSTLRLLALEGNLQGKKAAIGFGVEHSKGELILCTDGDCEVGQEWVDEHRAAYEQGAKLTFGAVRLMNENKARLVDVINLEQQALVAMGAATARMGRPSMINGCNYSFPKRVFEEVNGFEGNESIPTGDDEFLLRKIHQHYPGQIQFIKSDRATVSTQPIGNLTQFYNQRKRWASKWRFHRDTFSKLVPAFLFACYLTWSLFFIDSLSINSLMLDSLIINSLPTIHYSLFIILFAKLFTDWIYLRTVTQALKQRFSFGSFVLLQIIYPIYVVFFGLASNFGKYRWRERTYNI